MGWCLAAALLVALAGCGNPPSPATHTAAPVTYLLTIDQLVAPDFTVDAGPQAVPVAGASAARVDFFRPTPNIAVVNGPVQVGDTVEEFASAGAAQATYATDIAALDRVAGSVAVSTGSLGDAAHATTRIVTDPSTLAQLIEVVVEWRVDNLVDVLVVRGRYGGTRLDDALALAHNQTTTELGLATPAPRPS